ncbi:MAG: hypothetical protein CM1200mP2_49100 [Planctomycetaceae bacterium]|nr:MAG: hypothetical protein CM1200mP2_49100 [Planctomycetaceae bacterium]
MYMCWREFICRRHSSMTRISTFLRNHIAASILQITDDLGTDITECPARGSDRKCGRLVFAQ